VRTFLQKGRKHTLVWKIWVEGDAIHTQHGILEGRLQHTWDVPGAKGKEGTKAYKNPEEYALIRANQLIRTKVEAGYRELEENEQVSGNEINFSELPKSTCFFKCRQQPKEGTKQHTLMLEAAQRPEALITRKRDGMMHVVLVDTQSNIQLYTRRMDPCTEWYPYLVAELETLNLPPKTVLLCELVCLSHDLDDRKLLQTLGRSKAERAQRIQQENPFRRPIAVILAMPYYDQQPIMERMPVEEWLAFMFDQLEEATSRSRYLELIEVLPLSFEQATERALTRHWEGLVIYNPTAVFGDDVVTFTGQPRRPECWKWKGSEEGCRYVDDFVLVYDPTRKNGGSPGSGRLKHLPGRMALYQYDRSGQMQYICLVGTGFTDSDRRDVLYRAAGNLGIAGVARIGFESRTFISQGAKTNALTMPKFVGWHPDKNPNEAFCEDL